MEWMDEYELKKKKCQDQNSGFWVPGTLSFQGFDQSNFKGHDIMTALSPCGTYQWWPPCKSDTERSEREREMKHVCVHIKSTCKFRESSPIFMAMVLNKSDKPQVLSRAPWTSLHLALITAWCSSPPHDLSLVPYTTTLILESDHSFCYLLASHIH